MGIIIVFVYAFVPIRALIDCIKEKRSYVKCFKDAVEDAQEMFKGLGG